MTMANGIMYNPHKLYPTKEYRKWLSDTPDIISRFDPGPPFGRSLVGAKFYPVIGGLISYASKPIYAFSVHIHPSDTIKKQSVKALLSIVKSIVSSEDKVVIMGDMNFFEDGTALGPKCRELFER